MAEIDKIQTDAWVQAKKVEQRAKSPGKAMEGEDTQAENPPNAKKKDTVKDAENRLD